MSTLDSSGPAFPGTIYTHSGHISGHSMGMSLRDWFAGRALSGICARGFDYEMTADAAYEYADAMLGARSVPAGDVREAVSAISALLDHAVWDAEKSDEARAAVEQAMNVLRKYPNSETIAAMREVLK